MSTTPARGAAFLIEPVGSRDVFICADFNETDRMYAKTAEDFVDKEVLSRLPEIEAGQEGLMPQLLKRAGELGLLMLDIPEEDGGLGLSKATSMLVSERAAKCASFSVSWGAHTGIGTLPLVYYGTPAQKERYLAKLASGELLAAYALTEPGAGSDALAAKTRAVLAPDGANYVLNGVKQFITNAGFADLFTVFAKIDGEKFTAFLVERGTKGLSTGAEEQKLGIRGSSTRQVILENVEVPIGNVLGEIGQGHKIAFNILNIGRFKLGCGALGVAKECLNAASRYASERQQFGQPIASYGMIQRKIADMATRIYVADSMGYRTAGLMDEAIAQLDPKGADHARRVIEQAIEEFTIEDSIVKVFGTEALDMVADEALQIFGGYGFTADYPVERHYRDARINRIFEGTNEINRLIIPATLIKRVMKGGLPILDFIKQVEAELQDETKRPRPGNGPLALEVHATEMSKRLVAYVIKVLIERDLASLKTKQQHLEVLSNMIIDVYAMDSTMARTLKLIRLKDEADTQNQIDITRIFVASAHERVADGARRLVANEIEGEELRRCFEEISSLEAFLPIRTFHLKSRLAEQVVAAGGSSFSVC
ncbi:MAG: acyl-CoA dehydrogenase family protein [Deltaproteobacteria bacterium]|nr:acyl-CoA dehydrogenase family protein [Deltaproteobacteria bacterium]